MLAQLSLQMSPWWPTWVVLTVAAALFGVTAWGTVLLLRKGVGKKLVATLGGIRLGVLAVVVLILLQPIVSYTRTTEPLPEVVVLVDASRSMGQPGGNGSGTRLDEVLSALRKGDLGSTLHDRFRPRWFTLDGTATPVEEAALSAVKPGETAAQLGESLTDACNLLRAEGKLPARILLASDGNGRGTADTVAVARRLGVAVDVLLPTGEAPAGPALEIAGVQGARRVLLGSETHFRLSLRVGQAVDKDRTYTLRLTEDGKKIQEMPLVLKAGRAEQAFALAHRPLSTGVKQYDFQVRGQGAEKAEKKLAVQVVDSKFEILFLDDTWRWEYKFLHRIFEEDPSFRFTALLSRGSGEYLQLGSPDRRVNLVGFPQSRAELEGFDVFFLGDVNVGRWPPGLSAALAQLVTDEGKSLVVIAGPGLAKLADIPDLHALLPVDLTPNSGSPISGPVEVRVRPDAAGSPFFFQIGAGETTPLPPLDQVYPVLRKRPAATVLLEAAKHRNAYGNLIVLAEHTVGKGRVLFVGTDTLWKWQTLASTEGPSPYRVFWQQALRALTPSRTRPGAVSLWLTPSRTRCEPGRKLELVAELQSDRPLPRRRIQGVATLPDGKRLSLAFAVDSADPRKFRAELSPTEVGLHQVRATLLSEGKTVAEGLASFEVEGPGTGSHEPINRVALERIAAATGGRVIDPARPETWPTPGSEAPTVIQEKRAFDLWNSFTLLLVVCGLLGTDWFIRLFKGLV